MPAYSPRVKRLAYENDPGCWRSYSGKLPSVKRRMDARREASLLYAAKLVSSLESIERLHPDMMLGPETPDVKIEFPKLEKTPMTTERKPWPGFKAKIFIHIATCPFYTFLGTLAPARDETRMRSRLLSFDKYIAELIADGLVEERNGPQRIYTITAKGKVFADAMLTLPLPIPTSPKWVMPD